MPDTNRDTRWISQLRAAITLLVVAHHSTLAYTTFARFDSPRWINSTHAVVDTTNWAGLDIFQNFNDVFFMALMFLIGGLFLPGSIGRKGAKVFLGDRVCRLLLPFLLLGTPLMLLAYYPSHLLAGGTGNISVYLRDFFVTAGWPVGPPWFLWVLFLFNVVLVLCFPLVRGIANALAKRALPLARHPLLLASGFFLLTWLLYVPLAHTVGAGTWTGWGPFDFQLSRVLLYAGYFLLGALVGGSGLLDALFSTDAWFPSHWRGWLVTALIVYALLTVTVPILERLVVEQRLPEFQAWMLYYTLYVASCTSSCLAFLATFSACAPKPGYWWHTLAERAYLIYLLHFVFVTWGQYLLLDLPLSAFLKFLLVFIAATAGSWLLAGLLRSQHLVRRYC